MKIIILAIWFFIISARFALAQEISNQLLPALVDMQSAMDGGQASDVLNSMGISVPSSTNALSSSMNSGFSIASIIACLLFGAVGFVAFVYGKKQGSFKPLIIGILLMGYPYFVTDTLWLFGIGAALTALLFIWRD